MKIIEDIKNILESNSCNCFELDIENLMLNHTQTIQEARGNVCNHKVFLEVTNCLLSQNIDYELTKENHIKIKL